MINRSVGAIPTRQNLAQGAFARGMAKGKRQKVKIGKIASVVLACLIIADAGSTLSLARPVQATQAKQKQKTYACVMHPNVKANKPGKCPRCDMDLRVVEDSSSASSRPASNAVSKSGDATNLRIPDTPVYNQNGQRLRFYSDLVKGKTVAINFIFTTCTTICPPLTATFRKVQQQLGERAGQGVSLISISVDPVTDVPERLKAYSAKFNAGPGWAFVTGSKSDIEDLLRALGAYVGDKNDHSPMILVGNEPAGYWTRAYGLAPATTLVKTINEAAEKRPAGNSTVQVPVPGASSQSQESSTKTPAEAAASYFTNTLLVTQDNEQVRFFDDMLKGKTVLINFMFTTCTAICPPMTANLQKVQQQLGERVGRDITMISLTVDPTLDTPEVLKKFAANFKTGAGWYFLTGEKQNVDVVLRKLGGFVEDKNAHSGILIIGNVGTGDWMKVFAMAKPSEIASAVLKLTDGK